MMLKLHNEFEPMSRCYSDSSYGTAATDDTTIEDEFHHDIMNVKHHEPTNQPEKRIRKVHFGTVSVRDYEVTLGDHPCCSYGPPVAIGWDYLEYEPVCIDEFEFRHLTARRTRREMVLNYYKRKHLLSIAGFTEDDIKAMVKEVKRAKFQRSITTKLMPYQFIETAILSACRKCKRLVK